MRDSEKLSSLFNNGEWKNFKKTEFFKVKFYNPRENFFEQMSVNENVFNDCQNK